MTAGRATLIRTSGEQHEFTRTLTMEEIRQLIDALVLDSVNLKDGHVLMIDDNGIQAQKPVNGGATFIYQKMKHSTNKIHGDAVIVWDADYA
jgi:hypothetical protein